MTRPRQFNLPPETGTIHSIRKIQEAGGACLFKQIIL